MRNLTNISLPLLASITSFRGGYSVVNQAVANYRQESVRGHISCLAVFCRIAQ